MRHLLSLLVFSLFSAGAVAAQTGTAEFSVRLDDGGGVAGLPLTVYSADEGAPSYSATTDADGNAEVLDVPPGAYFAFPTPESGFLASASFPSFVGEADSTQEAATLGEVSVFEVDDSDGLVTLRGRILDALTGEVVRLATTEFRVDRSDGSLATGIGTVDGEGRFYFRGAPRTWDGVVRLLPKASNAVYEPIPFQVTLEAGTQPTLNLQATRQQFAVLSGTALDTDGAPAAGVDITAFEINGAAPSVRTRTSSDGSYGLDIIEGTYIVRAESPFYESQFFDGVLVATEATPVEVSAPDGASSIDFSLRPFISSGVLISISGRLVDSAGQPIGGNVEAGLVGSVNVFAPGLSLNSIAFEPVGVSGEFEVRLTDPTLVGEALAVRFEAEGFLPEFFDDRPTLDLATPLIADSSFFEIALGDIVLEAEGETLAGRTLSGSVRSESGALAGAVVVAARLDAPGVAFGTTRADGSYRIGSLADGRYVVLAADEGRQPAYWPGADEWTEAGVIDLAGADADGLMLRLAARTPRAMGSAVEGLVRDANGAPVPVALVTARDASGDLLDFAISRSDGSFRLRASGDVTLRADAPRFVGEADAMRVPEDLPAPMFRAFALASSVVVATDESPVADSFDLQIAPNPIRSRTEIRYALAESGPIRVAAYDALGREVAVLASGRQSAGPHAVAWETVALAAGVYVVRVETEAGAASRPVVVVR
ncbi:MAG: carboxypeptidase regulatory-like domain-containing protein [Bacteroidota bacterium]